MMDLKKQSKPPSSSSTSLHIKFPSKHQYNNNNQHQQQQHHHHQYIPQSTPPTTTIMAMSSTTSPPLPSSPPTININTNINDFNFNSNNIINNNNNVIGDNINNGSCQQQQPHTQTKSPLNTHLTTTATKHTPTLNIIRQHHNNNNNNINININNNNNNNINHQPLSHNHQSTPQHFRHQDLLHVTHIDDLDNSGSDDDDQPEESNTNLIINYLPQDMDDASLMELFAPYGSIRGCKVIKSKTDGLSLGYGFVTYEWAEDAQKAVVALNGFRVDGKVLKVTHSRPPASRSANLYVANLDQDISEEALLGFFTQYGKIVEIKIPTNKTNGKSHGIAFVRFDKIKDAQNAIKTLNSKKVPGVSSKGLTLRIANQGNATQRLIQIQKIQEQQMLLQQQQQQQQQQHFQYLQVHDQPRFQFQHQAAPPPQQQRHPNFMGEQESHSLINDSNIPAFYGHNNSTSNNSYSLSPQELDLSLLQFDHTHHNHNNNSNNNNNGNSVNELSFGQFGLGTGSQFKPRLGPQLTLPGKNYAMFPQIKHSGTEQNSNNNNNLFLHQNQFNAPLQLYPSATTTGLSTNKTQGFSGGGGINIQSVFQDINL